MSVRGRDRAKAWVVGATLVAAVVSLLGGCARFSADGGFGAVQGAVAERLGPAVQLDWARRPEDQARIDQRVAELLAQPLGQADAVQLALLNNRGLQAGFAELGVSEAEWVQAGRLPNPGLTLGRVRQGGEVEWELGVHLNLLRLLTLPQAQRLQQQRVAQWQALLAQQVLVLAADTRKAWVQAVAAEESRRYSAQVMEAAAAGAELARRMAQVGNFSPLQQAREQAFYADAVLNLARAEQQQQAARERLTRLLGLWGAQTGFQLPERLPDLPAQPREWPQIEALALAQRLDIAAARRGIEAAERELGLTRRTAPLDVLELGVTRSQGDDAPVQQGWEIGLTLPLFDLGDARVARATHRWQQARLRAADAAVQARSEVREAYGAYRSAWDIARHQRDEIVPLQRRISEENLLRYNGMLIGVFELLADARVQIVSVNAAIGALRDFWVAQADLEMALVGKPVPTALAGPAPAGRDAPRADH